MHLVAISDTGPLVSAFQCGRCDLLRRYFSVVYITATEKVEIENHGWAGELKTEIDKGIIQVLEELSERETMKAAEVARQIAADPTSHDPDWRHHVPEAEAIVLMQRRPELMIDQILLDEKAARSVAKSMGLSLTGFPGIVGRAGQDGVLTAAEIRQVLGDCQRQGTRYSDALIETVARTWGK